MTQIALSGPDNVGKSTQLRWLARRSGGLAVFGGIDQFHPHWPPAQPDALEDWWFACPTAEHLDSIVLASARRAEAVAAAPFAALDRGPRMFEAVCAATYAAKAGVTVPEALAMVERDGRLATLAEGVTELLLLPADDIDASVAVSLARETRGPRHPLYPVYQRNLALALRSQRDRGCYGAVLIAGEASILDLSDRIANTITTITGHSFSKPFNHLDDVLIFSGMSESGKSLAADIVHRNWDYCRLKIGYLAEVAAERLRIDIDQLYALPEVDLAEEMLLSLSHFASAHYYLRRFTLESAHRFEVTSHWKRLLGPRACVAFIETSESIRRERASETKLSLRQRDREKSERGVNAIAGIADARLSNDGTRAELALQISHMMDGRFAVEQGFAPEPAGADGVPDLLQAIEDTFDYYAPLALLYAGAMGSLVHGHWSTESDIDLLLVVTKFDPSDFQALGSALTALAGMRKLALNIVEETELIADRLNGNLTHKLRLASAGHDRTLFRRGWHAPQVTQAGDLRASFPDLLMAVTMLRRYLVTSSLTDRQVRKYVGLIAKILLRARGIHIESERSAISAARQQLLGGGGEPEAVEGISSADLARLGLSLYRSTGADW